MQRVVVSGSFDDLQSHHVRFLQEAGRLGPVHVLLWSDAAVQNIEAKPPKFPEEERRYLVESLRYVDRVTLCTLGVGRHCLPQEAGQGATWVVNHLSHSAANEAFCRCHGLDYRVIGDEQLQGFPERPLRDDAGASSRPRIIVTGCYDWFHSGHVRFFEEVSQLGDLYVVVGHDANIKLLKGDGHPMFCQQQRRYLVDAVRFVEQALISTGHGWLDAEPEIERIKPHVYAVNEDGDKPEKRQYCRAHGIEYRVLRRRPKAGLPARQSTNLRGF